MAKLAHMPAVVQALVVGLLFGLAVLLGVQLWQSLSWRMVHDATIVHYAAYLIDRHGFVPYRDLFDTVQPGTFLFHLAIGKMLGYGDLAFRFVDIVILLSLLAVTWCLQRPLGKLVAPAAVLVFGLIYLSYGPPMSLQRDYLGLLPVAAGLLVASRFKPSARGKLIRYVLMGALLGLSASIKPQLAAGLPVILLLAILNGRDSEQPPSRWLITMLQATLAFATGFIIVVAVPILWIWQKGGLPDLVEIVRQFLPLYLEMSGEFKVLGRSDRILYKFTSLQQLGGQGILLAPAALGGYLALFESDLSARNRRLVLSILILIALYGLYPALSGQFWSYHWMPFVYFATLGASLVLVPLGNPKERSVRQVFVAAIFIVAVALSIRPAPDFYRQLNGDPPRPPRDGRVDEIAAFLQENLQPGDRVQPLDWVNGGVNQALLLSGAVLATRYQSDSMLYHHVSSPYVQSLQWDFVAQLHSTPPRFIIEYLDRPRASGIDTIPNLPELQQFIAESYHVAREGHRYLIYERTQ